MVAQAEIVTLEPNQTHSFRSAITGSTLAERFAGIAAAKTATNPRLKTAKSKEPDMPLFIAANECVKTRRAAS